MKCANCNLNSPFKDPQPPSSSTSPSDLLVIFNLQYLFQLSSDDDDNKEEREEIKHFNEIHKSDIQLCEKCSSIFDRFYNLYTEFDSRRHVKSQLSKMILQLDEFMKDVQTTWLEFNDAEGSIKRGSNSFEDELEDDEEIEAIENYENSSDHSPGPECDGDDDSEEEETTNQGCLPPPSSTIPATRHNSKYSSPRLVLERLTPQKIAEATKRPVQNSTINSNSPASNQPRDNLIEIDPEIKCEPNELLTGESGGSDFCEESAQEDDDHVTQSFEKSRTGPSQGLSRAGKVVNESRIPSKPKPTFSPQRSTRLKPWVSDLNFDLPTPTEEKKRRVVAKNLKCPMCFEKGVENLFLRKIDLCLHLLTFHPQKAETESDRSFLCPFQLENSACAQRGDSVQLKLHILQEHLVSLSVESKTYNCVKCTKVFATPRVLEKHMMIHDNPTPFQCEVCSRAFRDENDMKMHRVSHDVGEVKDDDLNCPRQCGLTFKVDQVQELKEHLATCNVVETEFGCTICHRSYPSKRHLQRHQFYHRRTQRPDDTRRTVHSFEDLGNGRFLYGKEGQWIVETIGVDQWRCTLCSRCFKTKRKVCRHMREEHPVGPNSCKICKKSFKTQEALESHVCKVKTKAECKRRVVLVDGEAGKYLFDDSWPLFHQGNEWKCGSCNVVKLTRPAMTKHVRLAHADLNKFVCQTCFKTFSIEDSYKCHIAIHTDDRPFICDFCGKTFKVRQDLNTHKKGQHEPKRSYVCDICGKAMTTNGGLYFHKKIHKGIKEHSCHNCGKQFVLRHNLNAHLRKCKGFKF